MTEPESRSRRRGVRASRVKLTRALTEAGLKTQAALAERIADLEGLDVPPKDVVNRVFREQPVDPITLERIARALQTDAYRLYLTTDEPTATVEPPTTAEPAAATAAPVTAVLAADAPAEVAPDGLPATTELPGRHRHRGWIAAAVAASVTGLLLGGWLWTRATTEAPASAREQDEASPLQPKFGRFKVAITQFKGDAEGELAVLLHGRLEKTLGVPSAALPVIAAGEDRGELAQRFRVDAVIDGEIVQVGQLLAVRAYAYVEARGRRQQIWGESFPASKRADRLPQAADHVTAAVHRLFGLPAGESRNPPHFPLAPVQDEYLQGRLQLDLAPSEINLRRAANRFETAVRHDANYAAAHAGLCEVSLDAVWINEERQLADAEKACVRAVQLAPGASEVIRAHAYFLDRSGRADEASRALAKLNGTDPHDVETLLALAKARYNVFLRTGAAASGAEAIAYAREAAAVAPQFWKPWMWIGIFEAGAGTADAAIAALEAAHERDPQNEYVTTNLGTMYFCRGDFGPARDLYLKARELAPGSYAGTEFLGMIYYYLRDFGESARLRQAALDMARAAGGAEIHQMWGALGDSYRQAGRREQAVTSYVRALEIVERDFLTGTGSVADKAARAYYYLTLLDLDPRNAPQAAIASLEQDLDEALDAEVESGSLVRVSQAWLLKGDAARARAALDKATRRCRCYAEFPDVARLAANRATERG
ncbi:MAG: hypothetical protein KF790_07705 [Steroidobacteraceae bacterium]|nr:hypothetical protein [Steroidobacteraceae bacterium]